jgi:lipopolysaccharide exporter
MNLQAQTFSGIRWTALSSLVRLGVQIIQLAVLSQFLSPAEFGFLAIVQVIINFTQIFLDLGISNAIIHKQELKASELSSLYWMNVISGVLLFVFIFAASPFIAAFYHQPLLSGLMIQSAFSLLIIPFGQQFQALLQKEMNFRYLALAEITASVLGLGMTIFLLFNGAGLLSIIYATVFSSLLLTAFYFIKGAESYRPGFNFRPGEIRGFLKFGLYQVGERSLNFFSSGLDKLVIGKIFGVTALGFYSIAHHLLYYPLRLINPIINRVALPVYARMQDNTPELNDTYIKNISLITLLTFPVYAGLYAVSGDLVQLLMGKGWDKAAEIFRIIWILGIFKSMGNPLGSYLYAKGRADIGFYLNVYQLIVYVLALFAGSFYSFEQMLMIFVLANIIFLAPADYLTRYYLTRMPVFKFLKAVFPNLVAAAAMMFLVLSISKLLKDENILIRFSSGVIGGMVFYGLYFIFIYRRNFNNQES